MLPVGSQMICSTLLSSLATYSSFCSADSAMPCGLPPSVNVRTTVIVCQFTSSTEPPSRVATYRRLPFGCARRWCDVAGRASEPVTVSPWRSTLNNRFALVVTKSVLSSGEIATGKGSPVSGIVPIW